tara:strand:+ start:494 stop:661 length:168 start_codon:yes stop_codon:yes gene_type:complete
LLVEVEVELIVAPQEQLPTVEVLAFQVQEPLLMDRLEPLELITLVVEVVVPVITK